MGSVVSEIQWQGLNKRQRRHLQPYALLKAPGTYAIFRVDAVMSKAFSENLHVSQAVAAFNSITLYNQVSNA
jgi:hypothetical protein